MKPVTRLQTIRRAYLTAAPLTVFFLTTLGASATVIFIDGSLPPNPQNVNPENATLSFQEEDDNVNFNALYSWQSEQGAWVWGYDSDFDSDRIAMFLSAGHVLKLYNTVYSLNPDQDQGGGAATIILNPGFQYSGYGPASNASITINGAKVITGSDIRMGGGSDSDSSGAYSLATGSESIASGTESSAIGSHSTTTHTAYRAVALSGGFADAYYSLAASYGKAYGDLSIAFSGGRADGISSIAMSGHDWNGQNSRGNNSVGDNSAASGGDRSSEIPVILPPPPYLLGNNSVGDNSVAIGGVRSQTLGFSSFSSGFLTKAAAGYSTALGSLNLGLGTGGDTWIESDPLFELGNGIAPRSGGEPAPETRSNAMTILKNGQTTLTNKAWNNRDVNTVSATDDPSNETTDSGGNALVVDGHTILNGKVIISEAQGDISMGAFGN